MELTQAKHLALELMEKHNLSDWRFEFDTAKRRFGVCRHRLKVIGLSKELILLNSVEQVKNTILHEIAHALTPRHKHDDVWRAKAIEIGSDGNRCYSSQEVETIKGNYQAVCPICGHIHYKFRQIRVKYSCSVCAKGFSYDRILIFNKVK